MDADYELPNGAILRISNNVLETFYNYRQTSLNTCESGGILLGLVFSNQIKIEKATVPGKGDKRGRFFFNRHKKRAQSLINEAFNISSGRQIYIGEWHTHNQKRPKPSMKDEFEIRRAFNKSKLNLEYLICIIIGNDNFLGNIGVGYYNGKNMVPCKLRLGNCKNRINN